MFQGLKVYKLIILALDNIIRMSGHLLLCMILKNNQFKREKNLNKKLTFF